MGRHKSYGLNLLSLLKDAKEVHIPPDQVDDEVDDRQKDIDNFWGIIVVN
jgi:hypothetical protein